MKCVYLSSLCASMYEIVYICMFIALGEIGVLNYATMYLLLNCRVINLFKTTHVSVCKLTPKLTTKTAPKLTTTNKPNRQNMRPLATHSPKEKYGLHALLS